MSELPYWVQVSGAVASILMLFGLLFNFSVIKPLNAAIRSLRDVVDEIKKTMHEMENKRQDMDRRLASVEASTKSAHHRLDAMEGRPPRP
jgi:prefoldin subunit 5